MYCNFIAIKAILTGCHISPICLICVFICGYMSIIIRGWLFLKIYKQVVIHCREITNDWSKKRFSPSQVCWITEFIGIAHRSMGDWSPHYRQIIRNPGDNEGKLHRWDYFPNFRQPSSRNTLSSCFGGRPWVFLTVWDSLFLCPEIHLLCNVHVLS